MFSNKKPDFAEIKDLKAEMKQRIYEKNIFLELMFAMPLFIFKGHWKRLENVWFLCGFRKYGKRSVASNGLK